MKQKILVIEDEQDIQTLLEYNLQQAGYEVVLCENGEDGLWLAIEHKPDLILLDWMLPLLSGIELLRQLRNRADTREIPVIMMTARGEEGDRLRGLDGGADDYVTKPFSPAELVARVRAILRRHTRGYDVRLTGGDIELDLETKRVLRGGTSIHLGPTEFRLLEHFMRNQGRVYSRDQLLDSVWGDDVYVGMRTVDVHIRRLRKAINITGGPDVIRTVRSMGYAFDAKA
ncbi:MAG: phosphate regulon transcriptional regulator PhoB [Candidatus Puniceispirillaceae bacterium]